MSFSGRHFYNLMALALLSICSGYAFQASGHDFTKANGYYRYDPDAEVRLDHVLAVSDSMATVFLKVELNTDNELNDYYLTYGYQQNYSDKHMTNPDSVQAQSDVILRDNNTHYLKFETVTPDNMRLLVVHVANKHSGVSYFFDIPLEAEDNRDYLLMEGSRDIPVFRNYVHKNEPFRIVSVYKDTPEVFLYQYRQDFRPAAPPMVESTEGVDKSLTIDSLFTVDTEELVSLDTEGLYFVQSDTTTLQGVSFRVTGRFFPKYATAEALIKPLIYISTLSEMDRIKAAADKKAGLDRFWLDVTGSKTRAKNIIKQFYDQTTLVNKLFTTYKAGWKTDRGMIFLLYGVPDEVYCNEEMEEWIYTKNDNFSKIRFTFVRINNIFTRHHYELLRDNNYDEHWFRTIDLWRKGRKEI